MKETERPDTIQQSLKMMQSIKQFYPNIYVLYQLYGLIPVPIAGAERSFSLLKLIKTDLRNQTSDERLSDLTVLSIHKSITQQLNIEDIGLMQKSPPIFKKMFLNDVALLWMRGFHAYDTASVS